MALSSPFPDNETMNEMDATTERLKEMLASEATIEDSELEPRAEGRSLEEQVDRSLVGTADWARENPHGLWAGTCSV